MALLPRPIGDLKLVKNVVLDKIVYGTSCRNRFWGQGSKQHFNL